MLKENKTLFPDVQELTFITSESCNLNCKYCELSMNSTPSHAQEVKNVREALLNGSFLANYQRFIYDYNIDIHKIRGIELWGQEPTLTLDAFTTQIPGILKWLRECERVFFSTNGMVFPDRIIDFIKQLNSFLVSEKSGRHFCAHIQFSVDGFDEDIEARGANATTIFNNIKKIIEFFNSYDLCEKLEVFIIFHGVVTLDIMKNGLKNGVGKHWHKLDDAIAELYSLNKNHQIIVADGVSSAFQNPVNASKEEGEIVAQYLKECIKLNEPFKKSAIAQQIILNLYTKPIKRNDGSQMTREDILSDIVDTYNYNFWQDTDNEAIFTRFGCGTGTGSIKMRYDGTLVYCQNVIFSLSEKDLENKKGIKYDIQRAELKHNFNPNVFTSPKEDIESFIYKFGDNHFIFPFVFSQIVNQMYLLLENNQIHESYKNDPEKILRHADYMVRLIQCWYNQVIETGSIYSKTLGMIRFYCNGALDIIEQSNELGRLDLWK